MDDGRRFEEKGVWDRYDGRAHLHWNEDITHGVKYSVIAHNNTKRPLVYPSKNAASSPRALSAIQLDPSSEEAVDLSYASHEDLVDGSGHRPLEQCPTKYLGLVTKVIPARSPEFHSKMGKKAIEDEVNDLRAEVVWDESSVAEWSEVRHVKKDGMTPMVGLLFLIMGPKNAELDIGIDEGDPN